MESRNHVNWTRRLWREVQRDSFGAGYLNFISRDEGQDRVKAAYGLPKYRRLAALKKKYDPKNLFRINHNVEPSGE